MGSGSEIKRLYGAYIGSSNIRQIALPVAISPLLTANVAGATYGAWVDIALLATITLESLVVAVVPTALSAADEYTIDIGTTYVNGVFYANAAAVIAAGAAVIAAAHRAEVRVEATGLPVPLQNPVYIPVGAGVIGRCYGITAVAVTIRASIVLLQRF